MSEQEIPDTEMTVRDEVRFRVLRLLAERPDLSQREISTELGVSLGSVNYCLRALARKGALKIGNFYASSSKPRYAYILTARGMREKARLTSRFLARKRLEYELLQVEIARLEREIETAGTVPGSPRMDAS